MIIPAKISQYKEFLLVISLAIICVIASLLQLLFLSPQLEFSEIIAAISDPDSVGRLIIFEFRLPRILLSILVGIAFGVAGPLVQRLMHNPLASPDVLGVSAGSSLAVMVASLLYGVRDIHLLFIAFGGGIAIVFLINVLSGIRERVGTKFILIGVSLAAAIQALILMMLTAAGTHQVQEALVWLVGSMAHSSWERVLIISLSLLVFLPLVAFRRLSLEVLEIGEDVTTALGGKARRDTLIIFLLAAILTALATAQAGPVAFVAFASGPFSRILLGGKSSLITSGATGATIVIVSDLVAQLLPGGPYPVGLITGAVGAPFLLWVLVRPRRYGATS